MSVEPVRPVPRGEGRRLAVVLVAVAALVGALEAWRPGYFLWDDNATFYLPCFDFDLRTVLAHGEPPQLDFHQYLGLPHLASGQTGALYPPAYLATGVARLAFGDTRWAIDLAVALHLLVAAAGMLRLLRGWGVAGAVAAAAAGLWVSFPFVVQVSKSWVFVAFVAALLPWALHFLDRLLRGRDPGAAAGLAVATALLFLQGYVQYAVLAFVAGAVYAGTAVVLDPGRRGSRLRGLARAAAATAAGAGLAAPLLLPMLAAKARSASRATVLSYPELVSNALDPAVAAAAQVFRMMPGAVHLATGAIFYFGLPLFALLATLVVRRGRGTDAGRATAALAAAGVALLLSTRAWGVFAGAPFLGSFRWPFKAFLLALLFATLAAALAADRLSRDPRRPVRLAAAGLLAAGLAGNVGILFAPSLDRAFGVNRLEGDVAELRETTARRFPVDEGRVVSLWLEPETPRIERFLPFHFATLAGAYHLGGYDPLVPATTLRLAKGLEYSNIFRYELTPAALDYLAGWAVRFYLVPDDPALERFLAAHGPRLRLRGRDDGVAVWEDTAARPFASFVDRDAEPVRIVWGPAEVRLFPEGRSGLLRLRVAPLPGYLVAADGVELGAPATGPDETLVVEVPPGAREVVVRYVDVPLRAGLGIAAAIALSWLAVGIRRRRVGDRPPSRAP